MTSMPSKLESSLKTYPDVVLRNAENLVRAGLSLDEVGDILEELEEWLSSKAHFAPDIWEGPEGWYRQFDSFVIEGDAGETHLARIWRKAGLRKWRGVDLDSPKTWKARTASSAPKTSSD
jgi:hypothetical protein